MFEPISIPNKSPSAVVVKHTNVSNPGLRGLNTRKSVLKYPFATKWICYSVLEKGRARRAGLIYRVNVTVNGRSRCRGNRTKKGIRYQYRSLERAPWNNTLNSSKNKSNSSSPKAPRYFHWSVLCYVFLTVHAFCETCLGIPFSFRSFEQRQVINYCNAT